ncbi:MAG TPA: hypothetical protein VFP84_18165 [Kofleriaceae bacterium]|nr:hypothetical protein [Kofleriaceae bacterium]
MAEGGVQLHRIRITSASIAEVVGIRPLVSIPRAQVRGLRLRYGVIAEMPWLLATIGVVITAVGVVGLGHTVLAFLGRAHGVLLPARLIALSLVTIVCGPIALYCAFRRGWTLVVRTASSTRKLGFGERVTSAELSQFVDEARAAGLTVEAAAAMPRANVVTRRSGG